MAPAGRMARDRLDAGLGGATRGARYSAPAIPRLLFRAYYNDHERSEQEVRSLGCLPFRGHLSEGPLAAGFAAAEVRDAVAEPLRAAPV